jgi:DNA-binding GntR family transcriptional regulator
MRRTLYIVYQLDVMMETDFDLISDLDLSNLSDRVYHHIKRLIMTGRLKGGQRIPEQAIAEKFGVSRTPIREALRRLEEHGLVVIEPRRSTKVATLTLEDKKHIGEVRLLLGKLAARLLADKVTPEDCATLRDIAARCQRFAEAGDLASCYEADSLLHCEMAERSGNPYLAELTRILDYKVQLLRNIEDLSRESVLQKIALHGPLVEAVCRRDAEMAEKFITKHLTDYYFAPSEAASALSAPVTR